MLKKWRALFRRKKKETLSIPDVDVFPWLSPTWYRCRYPDVAAAGIPPLLHYLHHGGQERRDPSGLFSTRWYLEQNPEVAESGENALLHFLRKGMAEGRAPSPALAPGIYGPACTAVILVASGADALARATLESFVLAKTAIDFDVFLVDTVARDERRELITELASRFARAGVTLRAIPAAGASFAEAVDRGMEAALETPATHLCILRAGAVCPSGWLDDLVGAGEPVVGPVCNENSGNAQFVPIDSSILPTEADWVSVENFAQIWRKSFGQMIVSTPTLGLGCLLLHRGVVTCSGPLEERVGKDSGGEGYVQRLSGLGFELAIARHVYVHMLAEMTAARADFLDIDEEAVIFLAQQVGRSGPETLREALLLKATQMLAAKYAPPAGPGGQQAASVAALSIVNYNEVPVTVDHRALAIVRRSYERALSSMLEAFDRREDITARALLRFQSLCWTLAQIIAEKPVVLVLAGSDPVSGDEKDGYIQRVKAIDAALSNCSRIYVAYDDRRRRKPRLLQIGRDIWRVEIADSDPLGAVILEGVARCAVGIYSHSIYPLAQRTSRALLDSVAGPFVLDLHGAVPEECALYEKPYEARFFEEIETKAAARIDHLVCVSRQMAAHFEEKHGALRNPPIVCPIFLFRSGIDMDERVYNERPRVVYAGGLQRWQRVDAMVDLAADARSHSDFLFLTPSPGEMKDKLARRALPVDERLAVRAASHQEVFDAYAQCDFGLALREASPVNRVACPTKLIEYAMCGVIAILDTTEIGDFVDHGMTYVPIESYRRREFPGADERRRMARANLAVVRAMEAQSRDGLAQIMEIFATGAKDARPACEELA